MKKISPTIQTQVLVIGSGIAGASAAIELAEAGAQVVLITRASDSHESNTNLAQGGIVSRGLDDQPELLVKDILLAGNNLNNVQAVNILATDGPRLVNSFLLKKLKVDFFKNSDSSLHYTREAAHNRKRILHFADKTGEEIEKKLINKIKSLKNIQFLTKHTLLDLLTFPHHAVDPLKIYEPNTCVGAYVLDNQSGVIKKIVAQKTILATGGVGQVFWRTTNAPGARGDGLAAASRAGATVINAEYMQFHPTSFYHRDLDNFLISEAVRGEGGRLINKKGEDFMKKYDRHGSLAPRDVVARGIYNELLHSKARCVFLDIASHLSATKIKKHFANIYNTCLRYGVDITQEPIPVVPAAHYFCGGVQVDEWGKTNIKNLYAAGEVACTGLHGANRLASTSLLEGLVWGYRSAQHIISHLEQKNKINPTEIKNWQFPTTKENPDPALILADWQTIKLIMWNYVGIVRTTKRLQRAVADLEYLRHRIEQFYREAKISDDLIGLRSGITTAVIIAKAALSNPRSIGCHFVDN